MKKKKVPKLQLNKKFVKWFEKEQKTYGTEVAIYNLMWIIGTDVLNKAGVKHIETNCN